MNSPHFKRLLKSVQQMKAIQRGEMKPGRVTMLTANGKGRLVRKTVDPEDYRSRQAVLHAASVAWLHKRDISVLGSDASSDVQPSLVEGITQPVHTLTIVAMGTPILDNCDLERLSKEARKRKRWDFLLTTSPLTVAGATGSPLNPIAVF